MSQLLNYKQYIEFLTTESQKRQLDDLSLGILKAHRQNIELESENKQLREMKSITNAILCPDCDDGECCGTLVATEQIGVAECNECGRLFYLD